MLHKAKSSKMFERWHPNRKKKSPTRWDFKPPDTAKKKKKKKQMLGVNCVKTGQHSKAVCPGSFKPATEVHLSLLLFLQRGPPRFNWVLMESKSPLSLQPLELDRLIPPQKSFFFFLQGHMKNSHSAQSGHENPPVSRDGQWELDATH